MADSTEAETTPSAAVDVASTSLPEPSSPKVPVSPEAPSEDTSEAIDFGVDDKKTSFFDALNDDVLYRIFRATVGRPSHFRYKTIAGISQDPYDDFFGDRRGVLPTQNPGYPMVFVLPRVCRRWRNIMKDFPAVCARASVVVRDPSSVVPLTWWREHAARLETLFLDGHSVDGLGNLSVMNVGILSLLSAHQLRALCLGDCFDEGASRSVLLSIRYLTNLVQLQVYRAAPSFVSDISILTRLNKLRVLELGYAHNQVFPETQLSSHSFPLSLEKVALCEALIDMDVTVGSYLTNLKCLKLMSCAVTGEFCQHLGNLSQLTKLVADDSVLEGGSENEATNTDFLPDDLRKLSALENIKELSIQGMDSGPRGYFEWLGEEVLRDPPFTDLQSLSLCFSSLGVMAESFDLYHNLTFLCIVQIRFETLPEPVLRLPNLERLEMISCEISSFPDTVPSFSGCISMLNLSGNKLRVIPKGLSTWKSLQTLEFTENPILDFANIECLLQLPKLETVAFLEGMKVVDETTLDSLCQEFARMSAALKLGYVCAMLACKEPTCRVYL